MRTIFFLVAIIAMCTLIAHYQAVDHRQAVLDQCPADVSASTCLQQDKARLADKQKQKDIEARREQQSRMAYLEQLKSQGWGQTPGAAWRDKLYVTAGPLGITYGDWLLAGPAAALALLIIWVPLKFFIRLRGDGV